MSDFEARPFELTAKDTEGKVKEVTERLEAGVRELFESERYQAYLKAMSKFHDYSLNNTLLILMQKPDASLVAGFGKWRDDFERHVKRGEKGIKIFAPAPYTIKKEAEKIDPDTGQPVIGADGKPVMEQQEIKIPAFKVVSVFDVSQTDGKEIPDLSVDALTGSVEQYEDFWRVLKEVSPVPVELEKIEGGAHGYYSLADKRIAVDEGMSELQTIKTLIHEIAHAKLHDIDLNAPPEELENRPNRRTREVEAESIAFTVCQHFGLDTSDYSFGYVAGWSSDKEIKELKASLETIRTTASALITEIEERLQALSQQRETAQEQETAALTEPQPENTFSIYQLKGGGETRDYRFEPLERLRELGLSIQKDNYDLVYSAPLADGETLEDLFVRFNVERPEDFTGHSLSVSDVIVLHHGELQSAHYCDSFGFTEVPEFLQQEQDIRQETAQPVFAQIPPERQQAIRDEVQATLQMLVDTDMQLSGEVLQGTLDALAAQGYVLQDGQITKAEQEEVPPNAEPQEKNPPNITPLTDLQKKALEIAKKYDGLPMQDKIDVIAQCFGSTTGKIETSPCSGKWRGTSDVSIRFDTGTSLFIGNQATPKAKTKAVQQELVNTALVQYNPEIIDAAKETALAALMEREAKDNAIAAERGLQPYTLLGVEFNDGTDDKISGYMGWYYVTLAVDGKICSHMETGLNHDIAAGRVSTAPTRENYANDESWQNYVLHNQGAESWEQDKAEREMILSEFVPYMRLHCNLSEQERTAADVLENGENLTPEQTAYFTAVLAHVDTCREKLNAGDYHLPDPPQLYDFAQETAEMEAYKDHVREEIPQEAAAAGMSNEEYAANGYEPREQPIDAPEQPETPAVKYYQINEGAARRANDANSYRDYAAGSATAEYRQMVNQAAELAQRQKERVDPMYHEKIDTLLDTYARKLAANLNDHYAIEARVPSILIAGGSNFPVAKKHKQNAARDRNMQEWQDVQGILDKIRSTGMGGISADDPQAVAKLEAKLAKLEAAQETMKAVNAYYRKHKTLDGCPHLTPEQIDKLKADMAQSWHLDKSRPY